MYVFFGVKKVLSFGQKETQEEAQNASFSHFQARDTWRMASHDL